MSDEQQQPEKRPRKQAKKQPTPAEPQKTKPFCGVVMPISGFDTYTEHHWSDVYGILKDAIRDAGFEPRLVSVADDSGVIQKRIVHNLYDDPIVVVDVSGKNANVMLELGMRLAFDKPVIIVKDNVTTYAFDTAPIEHLPYPRDLRFTKIVEFKSVLAGKIKGTVKAADEPGYTTFLGHFERVRVAELSASSTRSVEYLIEELRNDVRSLVAVAAQRPSQQVVNREPLNRIIKSFVIKNLDMLSSLEPKYMFYESLKSVLDKLDEAGVKGDFVVIEKLLDDNLRDHGPQNYVGR